MGVFTAVLEKKNCGVSNEMSENLLVIMQQKPTFFRFGRKIERNLFTLGGIFGQKGRFHRSDNLVTLN